MEETTVLDVNDNADVPPDVVRACAAKYGKANEPTQDMIILIII